MQRCIIHGSFSKYLDLIRETSQLFSRAGIDVIAPETYEIVGETDGFVNLIGDQSHDPRIAELFYLKKLTELGPEGFSYYVNPEGRLGTSTSYELAVDQLTNTRYLFMERPVDHPAYVPENSVWKPQELVEYILENGHYPPPVIPQSEAYIYRMLQDLILPGSIIAAGAIIIDRSDKDYRRGQERDVLIVQTHKWVNRFSIVGGKVRRNEKLADALRREIYEETGLEGSIEESVCTFDEIENSGYFQQGTHRIFTDSVVEVRRRNVALNEEAESYLWIPPSTALQELDIEPNARKTLELYAERHKRVA